MKEIILRNGGSAIVDDFSFTYLSKFKWQKYYFDKCVYARRSFRLKGRTYTIPMHKEVLNTNNFIDHKDGNGLNNCISNLRPCTHSQNMMNRRKMAKATSKYKGVQWWKSQSKWAVRIAKNGKRYFIGYFENEIEAAKAYNKTAIKLFGEFARINNI